MDGDAERGRAHPRGWLIDRDVRPTVLVLGGFITSPPLYAPFRQRLLRHGAAHVAIANVWTPDWILAARRGLGPVATRCARAALRASDVSAASPASRGAPLLVVGHSAGGVMARILTATEPFEGRRFAGAGRIGAIVTLGSPHLVTGSGPRNEASSVASAFLAEHAPGAFFAPRVGYLTVASRRVIGRADGDGRSRTAYRLYQGLVPEPDAPSIEGDGLIPVRSALVEGTRQILLDDAIHGQGMGGPWYGSEVILGEWWPVALETWRGALEARRQESAPSGDRGPIDA